MLKTIYFFLLGMQEFRNSVTPVYVYEEDQRHYDKGREFMHKITLHYYE